MKRLTAWLSAFAVVLTSVSAVRIAAPAAFLAATTYATKAHAYEKYLGVLASSGASINQTTTASPFSLVNGPMAVQCDAAACIHVGLGSSTAASCSVTSANNGVLLSAGQLYDIPMVTSGGNAADTIAMIASSGSANCVVYQVVTPN